MVILKMFGFAVGSYAAIRLAGICFEWIRIAIDNLRPTKFRDKD